MGGLVNTQGLGFLVAQMLDAADRSGTPYDEKALAKILLSGATYTWGTNAAGLPELVQVANTAGPIYGLLPWPGKGGRLAQLSFCFPAKITSTSPLKATPVSTATGSSWTTATDFSELQVYTSDGSAPAVDTVGLVVLGTELHAQKPLFFQGGSGGGVKTYKVITNEGSGLYTLQQYDKKGGSTVGSSVAHCEELNLAPAVPANAWVHGITESDGVIRFNLPIGC